MHYESKQVPILHAVRALLPEAPISLAEMHELLPRLARAFRLDTGHEADDCLPTLAPTSLPSVQIKVVAQPFASMTYWDPTRRRWIIALSIDETPEERRFSLAHELGHIIWFGIEDLMFPNLPAGHRTELAERAADLFAGQLLLPYEPLSRAYANGIQEKAELAAHFGVSQNAVLWRLGQMDLPYRSSDDLDPAVRPTDRPRLCAPDQGGGMTDISIRQFGATGDTGQQPITPLDERRFLTIDEVARYLHISKWMVYAQINARKLKSVTIGARRLVTPGHLSAFVEGLRTDQEQHRG